MTTDGILTAVEEIADESKPDAALLSFNAARVSHGLTPVAAIPHARPRLTIVDGGASA